MKNFVLLLGHVGQQPEIKQFDFGAVANFTLATTERGFTTKDGKVIPDATEWHKIVVKGGLVKVVEGYVKKGTQLQVTGKIKTRSWEKDGAKHYVTEILCDGLELIGGKLQNESGNYPPSPIAENSNSEPGDDLPWN